MTTIVENQERETQVKEDIDFLFSHFEGRQRLFPRKMSTLASQGNQFNVYNKEQIIDACSKSNFVDCRVNAYPSFTDYKGIQKYPPNFIFADLDLSLIRTEGDLKMPCPKLYGLYDSS